MATAIICTVFAILMWWSYLAAGVWDVKLLLASSAMSVGAVVLWVVVSKRHLQAKQKSNDHNVPH
jgi:hypothetical protein